MNRHLTERMIGAIVLVAAAIILIPEMLSGPKAPESGADASTQSTASEGAKLKTYTIDLAKAATQNPIAEPPPRVVQSEAPPPEVVKTSASEKPAESKPASVESPPAVAPKIAATSEPSKTAAQSTKTETSGAKPSTTKLASSGESGWAVQVGSFQARATSDRLAGELKHDGFPAFVVAFQAGNQTLYRVRVGPVRDRSSAEALLGKLKPQHPTATVVPPA